MRRFSAGQQPFQGESSTHNVQLPEAAGYEIGEVLTPPKRRNRLFPSFSQPRPNVAHSTSIDTEDVEEITEVASPQAARTGRQQRDWTANRRNMAPPINTRRPESTETIRMDYQSPPHNVAKSNETVDELKIENVVSPIKMDPSRTFRLQLIKFDPTFDLDVTISYVWFERHRWYALVVDTDNFYSVIETSSTKTQITAPGIGQVFRFEDVILLHIITPEISTTLLSILKKFGVDQDLYYRILIVDDSKIIPLRILPPADFAVSPLLAQDLSSIRFSEIRGYFVPQSQ